MTRSPQDAHRWVHEGTKLLFDCVATMNYADWDGASLLPGWTRRHVVAHVASNADALMNLVRWASTGVPTPMYPSPEARAAGIDRGQTMTPGALRAWMRRSAVDLSAAMRRLTAEQWANEVVTAQGRTVPATEIPWLRAREVCVHTVDLSFGVTFADLSDEFLEALSADVVTKRGQVPAIEAALPERTAWLTGRPHDLSGAPDLGPWL